jgi:ankyrin repeat protein/nucleoside phosphorylase
MGPESRDDFRVAIICALPLEAAAVLDLFDQRYDKDGSKYGKQKEDTNTYSTGRIGRHDIVLAHMPGMGIYNATSVTSNIRLSFKEVNLALVVGVCGGAPVKQPIILGDVIISNSVVEFYTGRHYSDGVQARKGLVDTLGRPNPEIRGLLSKFQVPLLRRELEDDLEQNLAELCRKNDTIRYPGVEHDRLFAASYRHMHRRGNSTRECLCVMSQSTSDPVCSDALKSGCDELDCDTEAPADPSRRMRFASGFPTPRIHIGTVGVTSVMKSGEHRDVMANENNIIAFEMEGAGVWEVLPCVIIKGVCDYADSHKNKKWQDYAAATAASGAKAFLSHWTSRQHDPISAEGPSRKRPLLLDANDSPSSSRRARQQPLLGRQDPMSVLSTGETSSNNPSLLDQADLDTRKARLETLNFEQLDARHATIKTAHTATCGWLLSKSEYIDWQDGDKLLEHHGFLWIKGKPGAGKSTIMKHAYTKAEKHVSGSIAISYFFNARGEHLEKSTCGMYRSLLFQLLSKLPRLQAVLSTTEAASLQNTSPDLWTAESLQSLFRKTVERLEGQRLTCFVDALDECENNEDQVREMVEFFETLGECAVRNKIRLLVCFSSRHYPHITINKSVELVLELQHGHSEDIAKYVNSKLKVGRGKRVERIKMDVQKNSQGIFLWVVLVIPMLQRAYDHGQVHDLEKCLKSIPRDLHELFRDILGRDTQNMENLVLCLRWILYAERPLRAEELYFAILSASCTGPATAWDPEEVTREDISRFLLSSSKGLAEPTKSKTPTIQFIHESVRDFLLKENELSVLQMGLDCTSVGPIHDLLKGHCQRYCLSVTAVHELEFSNETTRQFPFLDYSTRFVFKHAELAATHGISQEGFLKHFPLGTWIALHDHIEQYKIRQHGRGTSLLYILTEMNLFHLFRVEVGQSQSINAKGGRYDYPFIAAAAVGNEQMLELLLEHGADFDKKGKEYKNALSAAVDKSNAPAIEFLMNNDASTLWTAVARGDLLEKAVKKKDMSVIKLLLRDGEFQTAANDLTQVTYEMLIGAAVKDQDDEVFNILIDSEIISHVDRGVFRNGFLTALKMASRHGKEVLVHMLLDKRGPYYAGDYAVFSAQPLQEAVANNHETIVRILLENGTDINSVWLGQTGLHLACSWSIEAMVRILLENGANIEAVDQSGRTALHSACSLGHEAVVRILLDNGANINAVDRSGDTGFFHACRERHEAVVRILLDNGANINAVDRSGDTGFFHACREGHNAIVRILLDNGANINAVDRSGDTGLFRACKKGREATVRILLENGADVNKANPLFAALANPFSSPWEIVYGNLVSTLLSWGADPNQYSSEHDLPLHKALAIGWTAVVKLLLEHGADVSKPSSKYENAFAAARSCENPVGRSACEALLYEKSVVQAPVPYLTWVDGIAYMNFPQ